jgi:hypothetical protein
MPMATARCYLSVPFSQKDEAKTLGAKWDPTRKLWYVPQGLDTVAFQRWRSAELEEQQVKATSAKPSIAKAQQSNPAGAVMIAVTQPLESDFVPYSGEEPPWE